ncbi:MAG: C69 family dipeptidase [Balneolales bacterium]
MNNYYKSSFQLLVIAVLAVTAGWHMGSWNTSAPVPLTTAAYPVMDKSIGFYIGSDMTEDGSVILGGFGHEPSSHWIDIVPAQTHPDGSTLQVGVTMDSRIGGELTHIPQVRRTNKYISSTYSEYAGFPPPLTNGGLNEHGLAARDIWSPSRRELVAMTEVPQRGPNYSDLARIAMERAGSAREAVEIIGKLIDEYGYSSYGGNSHLFADKEEGWVFINYAGGHRLWAAERLGPDDIRVSYPGYINAFPADRENNDDFMSSDNLVGFAIEHGWWDPETDDADSLDLQAVFGEPFPGQGINKEENYYAAARMPHKREAELKKMAPVGLEDMLAHVRDPRWSNDLSGYGQVAHLRAGIDDELQTLWLAVTGAVTTPFVPIPIATQKVPPEFLQHRYLTKNSDSRFLAFDYAMQEASRYAVREFKRLMYYTCENPQLFLHPVTAAIEDFESTMLIERDQLEAEASGLLQAGNRAGAQALLTDNVGKRLLESLDLAMSLTRIVEEETRNQFGFRLPAGNNVRGETIPPASQSMAMEEVSEMISCYDPDLDHYPRAHGIYSLDGK